MFSNELGDAMTTATTVQVAPTAGQPPTTGQSARTPKVRVDFPRRVAVGDKVKVKVKVLATNPVATGHVRLKVNGKTLSRKKLANGKATMAFRPHRAERLVIRIIYTGDDTYTWAKSRKKVLIVRP